MPKSLVEGELFIRQQFFKELEISDQEMEQHPIAPTCYHYISHIYRQFEEANLAIALQVCCLVLGYTMI